MGKGNSFNSDHILSSNKSGIRQFAVEKIFTHAILTGGLILQTAAPVLTSQS